jgi:MraZ protein
MFSGEFECKLDAKGRLVLPARLKSNLPEDAGNEVMLVRGMDPCIELYSMIEYNKLYSKFAGLNSFNPETRMLQRSFFRGVNQVELDSSGRLLIPKIMMTYANLDKDAVLVGMGSKIEIWSPETYNNFLINPEEYSKLAEKHLGND